MRDASLGTFLFGMSFVATILLAALFLTLLAVAIIPSHTGVQAREHGAILAFLCNPFSKMETLSFLTPDEISHLVDVRWLLVKGAVLLAALLALLPWSMRRLRDALRKTARTAAFLIVTMFGAAALGTLLTGFTDGWSYFHAVFFPQGNWAFPATSVLITLYPETYFLGCALLFAGFSVVLSATVLAKMRT